MHRLAAATRGALLSFGAVCAPYGGAEAVLRPRPPACIVGGMTASDVIVAVFADFTRQLVAQLDQLFQHTGFTRSTPPPASGFSNDRSAAFVVRAARDRREIKIEFGRID